jgi:protein-tyrosine phosphatase
LRYTIGEDTQHKVIRLLDLTDNPHDVADPWYTGDFETTYRDILEGCKALLKL